MKYLIKLGGSLVPGNIKPLVRAIQKYCKTNQSRIFLFPGGGDFAIDEAIKKKADLFVTGEFPHESYHTAKEKKLSIIAAGHYATETLGVKALMPVLKEKFAVNTVFLDTPTKL